MRLQFEEPLFLLLSLLGVAAFIGARRRRDLFVRSLRAAIFVAIAFGAARPGQIGGTSPVRIVFVVDSSMSVGPQERSRLSSDIARRLELLPAEAEVTLVRATVPVVVRRDAGRRLPEEWTTSDAGDSRLGAALDAALLEIPAGEHGRIVLYSDAESTDDGVASALRTAADRGIPIDVVPSERDSATLRPVALELRGEARVGVVATVVVALEGRSPGRVTFRGPDAFVHSVAIGSGAGRSEAACEWLPVREGFARFSVEVAPAAGAPSTLEADLPVDAAPRVIVFSERVRGSTQAFRSLAGASITYEDAGEFAQPIDAAVLRGYDAIVLDDVPADRFSAETAEAVISAVTSGGTGLFVCGGESSFAQGGYHESPLGAVLPVELIQKEEKRDPSTTLVVIIDTSGSMSGTRIQMAKETARLAMRRLLPHDKVGIVEFHGAKRWAAPIQAASNAVELQRALNRLDAGGGTVIFPAMEEAYYALQNVQTRYKHILVLTDGGVESGPFETLIRRMVEKGITVSTVLTGPEAHSEFLVNLANWGKGRFYTAPGRFNLPEIILKQPTGTRRETYLRGESKIRTRGGSTWLSGIDVESLPALNGWVETISRPDAETWLENDRRQPILATWRRGLGRVTAFMSEPAGPGTSNWQSNTEASRLIARMIEATARPFRLPFEVETSREGSRIEVRTRRIVDAEVEPGLRAIGDSGSVDSESAFERRSPTEHASRLIERPDRGARIEVFVAGNEASTKRRFVVPPAIVAESHADPRRSPDASVIARSSGGRVLEDGDVITLEERWSAGRVRSLVPHAFILAIVLYLLDIYARRRDGVAPAGCGGVTKVGEGARP